MGGTPMPRGRAVARARAGGFPVQSVALVSTTPFTRSNRYRRIPSATFTGAACSVTRRGELPATSTQYTASGTVWPTSAATVAAADFSRSALPPNSEMSSGDSIPGSIALICVASSPSRGDKSSATIPGSRARPLRPPCISRHRTHRSKNRSTAGTRSTTDWIAAFAPSPWVASSPLPLETSYNCRNW